MKKTYWFILLALLAWGCGPEPMKHVSSENTQVTSHIMTVVEGRYVVYKVDAGEAVYFVVDRESGKVSSSYWNTVEYCGESCTVTVPHRVLGVN